jgi:diguanylate cyclase (GGDEF)-like protein
MNGHPTAPDRTGSDSAAQPLGPETAFGLDSRRANQLQAALYEIADLAGSDLDLGDMLQRMHAVVGGLMYAPNLFITLYDAQRQTLRFVYFVDTEDTLVPDPQEEIPVGTVPNSLALAVIRGGRALMGSSQQLARQLGIPDDSTYGPDCAHWLGVPVLAGGEVRGAIVVQSYDPQRQYSEADRDLLGYMARHILTALLRKQAQEELERRVEQRTRELAETNRSLLQEVAERERSERLQAALFRIADLASSELEMSEMLRQLHAVIGDLMYAENFFIALYDRARDTLRYIYFADTVDLDVPDPDEEIPAQRMANSLTMGLIRQGHSLMGHSHDIYAELGRIRDDSDASIGPISQDWLGVPMLLDGEVRGALVVQSYDARIGFSDDDRALLSYVAQHILTALLRRQARAELERQVELRTCELAEAVRELRGQIEEREKVERRLTHEILHDALTGLPNRTSLLDALGRALSRTRRDPDFRFAVLFLDLDRFKIVNDSVGHLVGDEMLRETGIRLVACVREPDLVARLGGDEFALLLEDVESTEAVVHVAQRLLEAFATPMRLAGKEVFTSASIGIAMSHARYHSAEELLRDADVAMYRAKERGRQRFELFDEPLHREALRLLDLEGDLRRAILRREFEPHFQSIVRLDDGAVVGREALLRWHHPERGLLLPGDFLGVANDSGSIEQIDWQVFELACGEVPRLTAGGGYVALNVGARHFRSPDLARSLLRMIERYQLAPSAVRIEITEDALLENPEQVCDTLGQLRSAGVLVALDDFGTGYSSLSYLHRFPLHTVKIDRSFVADLITGNRSSSIAVVRAVLALANALGMEVVAEGIETSAQRDCLLDLGCRLGQGFLFAHPRPAASLVALH